MPLINLEDLCVKLQEGSQSHLWDHMQTLSSEQDKQVFAQFLMNCGVNGDFKLYRELFEKSVKSFEGGHQGTVEPPKAADIFEEAHEEEFKAKMNGASVEEVKHKGLRAIAEGKVCVLIMAGGMGTRLGYSKPKGLFVCPDLVEKKSIFQIQFERIYCLQKLATEKTFAVKSCEIQLVLMTSPQTDKHTRDFLAENNYFGLVLSQIHFFMQGVMPCADPSGKILLETPTSVCTSPDGNGGIYAALVTSDIFPALEKKGVKYIQVFSVDNILARFGDPMMVGIAEHEQCEMVVKSCPKVKDGEKVGVFAKRDSNWTVVEYTEIGDERAAARNAQGRRLFDAGHICINMFGISLFKNIGLMPRSNIEYHIAKKKIPTLNGLADAIKLESFIFDFFTVCPVNKFKILQVPRYEEFSPIKNADDAAHTNVDSPFTAARDIQAMHFHWCYMAAEHIIKHCEVSNITYEEEVVNLHKATDGSIIQKPFKLIAANKQVVEAMVHEVRHFISEQKKGKLIPFLMTMNTTLGSYIPRFVEISSTISFAGENLRVGDIILVAISFTAALDEFNRNQKEQQPQTLVIKDGAKL